jgi:GAF domain-containing protein
MNVAGASLQDGSSMTSLDHSHTLTSAVAELQELLLSTTDVQQFLDDLSLVAAATMGDDTSCGITLSRDGRPVTVASSDGRASELDEVQYGHDDGPCLHSMRTGEVVDIPDLAEDERWDEYRVSALAHGARSSLSMPLRTTSTKGAMNLYAGQVGHFGAEERALAQRLSDEVSRAVGLAVRLAEHAELNQNLEAALASRSVIDQAIGIVMDQNRCTPEDAFQILRAASNHRNVKLRVIAEGIVTAVSGNGTHSFDSSG